MLTAFSNADAVQFHTTAHAVVANCSLGSPAFGSPSSGVLTAEPITSDTNTAAGTVAHAHLYEGATELCTFIVGVSATEIVLSSLVFAAGDTLSMSSLTITMPAS